MNKDDIKILSDKMENARIIAGAKFERLCNSNKYLDACVFQSIRDSLKQNIQLLQSYESTKIKENTGYWLKLKGDDRDAICSECHQMNVYYGTYCKHCGVKIGGVKA